VTKEIEVRIRIEDDFRGNGYRLSALFGPDLQVFSRHVAAQVLAECANLVAAEIKDRIIEEVAAQVDVNVVAEAVTREIVADAKRRILEPGK